MWCDVMMAKLDMSLMYQVRVVTDNSIGHSNYQIGVNRTKSETPSTKSGTFLGLHFFWCWYIENWISTQIVLMLMWPAVHTSAVFDYRYRYRYRDISPYRIISISTPVISKLSIWRHTIQPAVRLDERVSHWFNLTGGRRRVNHLARQWTAGSRGRQSPIVGVRGGWHTIGEWT